jgi:Ca2+-transporting ATPase
MACGFEVGDKRIYFAKGDPEIILRMCKNYTTASGVEKSLDFDFLLSISAKSNSVSQKGDRPIALAYSLSDSGPATLQYTFLCLLQLENPITPGTSEVVKELRETGVRTLILTGDGPEASMKVGKEIGIDESDYCLTGKNIAQMDLAEIAKQSNYVSIFARLLPSQKGILIMSLQQRNKFVIMVGDGANDTIALKVANVGISFIEKSSPLAKRASKILINNLADLVTIIQSARRVRLRAKRLMLLRALILVSMFIITYLQILT